MSLRVAALRVLSAWDRSQYLADAIEGLRGALETALDEADSVAKSDREKARERQRKRREKQRDRGRDNGVTTGVTGTPARLPLSDSPPGSSSETPQNPGETSTTTLGEPCRGEGVTGKRARDPRHVTERDSERDSALVTCPPDLRLLDGQRGALETSLIPGWAIDILTARFVAKAVADLDERRTLTVWRKCLASAISSDWNNPNRRPKKPAEDGADWDPERPLPDDFKPNGQDIHHAATVGLDADRELPAFRDYTIDREETRASEAAWHAAYRRWLSAEPDFRASRKPRPTEHAKRELDEDARAELRHDRRQQIRDEMKRRGIDAGGDDAA